MSCVNGELEVEVFEASWNLWVVSDRRLVASVAKTENVVLVLL